MAKGGQRKGAAVDEKKTMESRAEGRKGQKCCTREESTYRAADKTAKGEHVRGKNKQGVDSQR